MLLPLYVTKTSKGVAGRSPLIEGATFEASNYVELCAEVRESLPSLMLKKTQHEPEHLMSGCDGFEPYVDGDWSTLLVSVGPEKRPERKTRNISLTKRLDQRIEDAAKAAGVTWSAWVTQAATERLARMAGV